MKISGKTTVLTLLAILLGAQAAWAQSTTRPTTRTGAGTASGVARTSRQMMLHPLTPPTKEDGPSCDFDAIVYELKIAPEEIVKLDADELNKSAKSADDLEKALAKLGEFRALYRANQSIALGGDAITIGAQVPYITNSQVTSAGKEINTIAYSDIGVMFNMAGAVEDKQVNLRMRAEIATLSEASVTISQTLKAPLFRAFTLNHAGMVKPDVPFVLLGADAANKDNKGKAVVYLIRVKLGQPDGN